MGDVTLETKAYAKMILHAAKYPHCAVNGILLADAAKVKDGTRVQDMEIVDCMPLFHHSHYVTPMAEVALTQIENMCQTDNRVIAGYYVASENFKDNSIHKYCPGQKIAEKIVEYFPSAVFVVIDNKSFKLEQAAVKMFKYSEGRWKPKDANNIIFQTRYVLDIMYNLLSKGVQRDLVDFDNYLDDITLDWTNLAIEKLVASINASNDDDD